VVVREQNIGTRFETMYKPGQKVTILLGERECACADLVIVLSTFQIKPLLKLRGGQTQAKSFT